MADVKQNKGVIGILTGGGDVPGLNPAIRAVTIRAIRDGYQVIGIRRGWAGVSERCEMLQHRAPAAPLPQFRDAAVLHHDQRVVTAIIS